MNQTQQMTYEIAEMLLETCNSSEIMDVGDLAGTLLFSAQSSEDDKHHLILTDRQLTILCAMYLVGQAHVGTAINKIVKNKDQ